MNKLILELLKKAITNKASDIFIIAGCPVSFKINDEIINIDNVRMNSDDTFNLINQIYDLNKDRKIDTLTEKGDDDFSFSVAELGRFRCNAYKQRNSLAAVLRVLSFDLPDAAEIGISPTVINLYKKRKGLVLITGSAGSGKSTTLSCIIDKINEERNCHIITIEDPIEFIHKHKKSIVSQREVKTDTRGYVQALRAALRQAPDIILLGEMRDYETISTAITAAETGQLVLSTLHTIGASKTIDRIIDVFPESQQNQIRIQLSMVLEAVVSQQLVPDINGKLIPAFEIMTVNSAIRNLIRESKVHQIDNIILSSSSEGMVTMNNDLFRLYKEGKITEETLLDYSDNPDQIKSRLKIM